MVEFLAPGALSHAVLRAAARLETAVLPRPLLGSSLLLAARRKAQPGSAG